ncbi:MAG TPA: hypothetical protein VLH75_09010 [Longimicrobiales bacterium]|nr:hypothetical protein [Longimicrobiales bacterium]
MKGRRWMRAGLTLLLVMVAWATLCGVASAQEKPQLAWYGYVKLDASWDEALVNPGNYARWVVSEDVVGNHSHFNMTARQTRLGFTAVSKAGGATLNGRWESDFYAGAGAAAENRNALQVRHAYVDVVWPSGWSVLAGQASDVVSPLNPATLNYIVAWWGGNTGYRRPQLRVTRRVKMGEGKELRIEGAATRTIGDEFVASDPGDTGADSGTPSFQGLMGVTTPVSGRSLGLGVYGHSGEENLHSELGGDPVKLGSSSLGMYLTLPMGAKATLNGEAWAGTNMDDYMGGIAQGIRVAGTSANEVAARGGWAELALRSAAGTQVNFGYSVDDPDDDDLARGSRSLNRALWANVTRDAGGGLRYGVELSNWETRYVEMASGKSWRVQTSVQYSF